jgi:hypothetical protein
MGRCTKRLHPLPDAGCVRGGDLPEYVFTIRSGGQTLALARVVACNDDDEALGHARAMVRKLRKNGGYNDPNLTMNVFDDRRPFVFCLPVPSRKRLKLISPGPSEPKGPENQDVAGTKSGSQTRTLKLPGFACGS